MNWTIWIAALIAVAMVLRIVWLAGVALFRVLFK